MKQPKKFSKWLATYLNEILVLLIIIVIALYIIKFANVVTDKAETLITSFAAIASTFFLFLAFRESKLNNKLKLNEPFFRMFENEISELKIKSDNPIFPQTKGLSYSLNYPESDLKDIKFKNISNSIPILLLHVLNNTKYFDYLKILNTNYVTDPNDEEVKRLCFGLTRIWLGFQSVVLYYSEVLLRARMIEQSNLEDEQKKYLLNQLDYINYDLVQLHDDIKNKNAFGNIAKDFVIFDYDTKDTLIKSDFELDFNLIIEIHYKIKEITSKYRK
jgi:hypothetical protein